MTKLFEFIADRGHVATKKRAHRKHPDLAQRDDVRRNTKPGVVLGSEGPGGLDGFFGDMDLELRYRPWWWKATLHVHWWLETHGPRATRTNVRAFWQRGKRGWADVDTWNLDRHLSLVIRDSVIHLRDTNHGHPGSVTPEQWDEILTEISQGMQAHLDMMDVLKTEPHEHPALQAKSDLALDHLKTYWGSLWD